MNKMKVTAVIHSLEMKHQLIQGLKNLHFLDLEYIQLASGLTYTSNFSTAPGVILVDLTKNEAEGLKFMRKINRDSQNTNVLFALCYHSDPQSVITAINNGANEVINYPDDIDLLKNALQKHFNLLNKLKGIIPDSESSAKIITLFANKGGSGSTTIAINLAYELSQQQVGPILFIDLDQAFINSSIRLKAEPVFSLGDLARNNIESIDYEMINRIIYKHPSGLDIINGCKEPLANNVILPVPTLAHVLSSLKERYSYIILDLPCSLLDQYHQYLVEESQKLLLITCMDLPSLHRTQQYLSKMGDYLDSGKIKLILNRWDLPGAYSVTVQELEKKIPYNIAARLCNDWELNIKANSMGDLLKVVDPHARLVKDLRNLAWIVGEKNPDDLRAQNNTSILTKVLDNYLMVKKGILGNETNRPAWIN